MMPGKISEAFAEFVLMLIISFSFAFMGITDMGFSPEPLYIVQILLVILLIFSIIFISKKVFVISFFISFVSFLVWIIYCFKTEQIEKILMILYGFFIWLYEYATEATLVNWAYAKILSVIICIGISFGIFILTKRKRQYLLIIIIGSGYFLYLWYKGFLVVPWTFYLFLFSCLLFFFRYQYYRFSKFVEKENFAYFSWFMIWGTIISAVVFTFSYRYSTQYEVNLQWVNNIINKITAEPVYYYETDYFSLSSAGFGKEDGSLGGNLETDDTLVLIVTTPKKVYLKGMTRDTYTGYSWINSRNDTTNEVFTTKDIYFDSYETMAGIRELLGKNYDSDKYFDDCSLKIKFNNIITKSIFVPERMHSLRFEENDDLKVFMDSGDALSLEKVKGKDYTYSVDFYHAKKNDEAFISLMRNCKKDLYKDNYYKITKADEKIDDYRKKILQELIVQSEEINTKYFSLPDTLPKRVVELAYDISKDEKNDYDKVKAIENYFFNDFLYTYNPGEVPEGRDFVDYFLFDSKQGYCTYYATAMTILVRAIGLPARYVEGYCLTDDIRYANNEYWVTNRQAHAWTEVYFEGIGWVSFEPTPPFRAEYEEIHNNSKESTSYYEEYYKNLLEQMDNSNNENERNTYSPLKKVKPIMIIICIGFVMLIIVLYHFIKYRWKLRKIIRGDERKSAITIYEEYLKITKLLGYPIKESETPLKYSKRVNKMFKDKEITQIFLKARYSQEDLNKEEIKIMYDFYISLLKNTKERIGKFKFYILRLFLGRI